MSIKKNGRMVTSMSIIMGTVKDVPEITFATEEESYEFLFSRINRKEDGDGLKPIRISNDDGFIHVKTKDNYSMAIPFDEKAPFIYTNFTLNSYAYIISTGNVGLDELNGFDGIAFSDGALKKITWNSRPDTEFSDDGEMIFKIKQDRYSELVDLGSEIITIELYSNLSFNDGLEGYTLNSVSEMRLLFEEKKPLIDCFNHYYRLKELISFLTFRKNVGFEEISLLKRDTKEGYYTEIAKVIIKDNVDNLKKQYVFNITFEDIKDVLGELLKIIYAQDEKEGYVSLGFIPDDDTDCSVMTIERLRDVITALECELEYVDDINVEANEELKELIELVKNKVKEYRETGSEITENTYSSIFSSINRWRVSLKERTTALCKKYEEEITLMNSSKYAVNKESIKKVVDCRNDATHGRNMILTTEIASVTHLLAGVVYCCILERVGIDREKIKEICKNKLLR